ncbi:amine oxidase [Methylomonas sp. LL1]|nr:amine oxidase [Methylomonas sp. LL1]
MISREQTNTDSLARFERYMAEAKPLMQKQYQQLLAQDLSKQQWDRCFQRNVLAVLQQSYELALQHLQTLPFDGREVAVDRGLSQLTRRMLAAFDGFVDEFLLFAVDKHRTSCALSNFPDEHKPDNAYLNQVKRDIAELWQGFAINANDFFLECR